MKSLIACERGQWHLRIWPRDAPDRVKCVPFRCRSWRHKGDCSDWRGAQDFQRVSEAVNTRSDWTYLVLTYPQKQYPRLDQLYKATVVHWSKLRQRMIRRWGKLAYVQTWEQHASGYPHVNLLIGNESFHYAASLDRYALRRDWLERHAVASGFGFRTWVEPMRNARAMAGYLVKLARELTGHGHKNQTPVRAPLHFRRLRASRGLLPPPFKDESITGELVRSPVPKLSERIEITVGNVTMVVADDGEVLSEIIEVS